MKIKLMVILTIILFIFPSCSSTYSDDVLTTELENSDVQSEDKVKENINFQIVNNQKDSVFKTNSFFAADNILFYLGNDGFYNSDNNKKLSDYYMYDCIKIGEWIYGNILDSEPITGHKFSRISLDGTKYEVIIDLFASHINYTSEYIYFTDSGDSLYRCDYSGTDKIELIKGKISFLSVTEDSIIFVKPKDNNVDKIYKADLDCKNIKEIATVSNIDSDLDLGGRIIDLQTNGNDVYFYQVLVDENLQNPITKLFRITSNSQYELILSNEGVYNYMLCKDSIIAGDSDNIMSYNFDGSNEKLLYKCPEEDFISTIYYNDEKIYFCLYKDDSQSILHYNINNDELNEVVKDLPLTGLIEEFMEIFSI